MMRRRLVEWLYRSRRKAIIGTIVVALAAVGGGVAYATAGAGATTAGEPSSGSGATMSGMAPGPASGTTPKSAIFTDTCSLTRTANDDPILMPGRSGAAMLHNFFGNTTVTASSTASSLRGGPTNCSTSADASSYWTPVLYQHGVALKPSTVLIYWRTPGKDAATTHTMPTGISMIAGNEAASAPQGVQLIQWQCKTRGTRTRGAATPQTCAAGGQLRVVIRFPSCWDGHSLDGATQDNVVYPSASDTCPSDHPVRIPQIVFHETYPTSSAAALTLSMGPDMQGSTDTEHVDFVNGWSQQRFDADVSTCITGGKACGRVSGADATPAHPQNLLPPRAAARAAKRARHHH